MSELVRSPQLLNCGKHVSEPLRAIAVAAKIKADDDAAGMIKVALITSARIIPFASFNRTAPIVLAWP